MKIELLSEDMTVLHHWQDALKRYAPVVVDSVEEFSAQTLLVADYATCGTEILAALRMESRALFVVLEGAPSPQRGRHLLAAGARAYGNAFMQPVHLRSCIETVSLGEIWVYPELVSYMVSLLAPRLQEPVELPDGLTRREQEIVKELLRGDSNRQIAERLAITERTVKAHLANIYRKMGVSGRVDLLLRLKGG